METLPNARRVEPSASHRFILPFCGRFAVSNASRRVCVCVCMSACAWLCFSVLKTKNMSQLPRPLVCDAGFVCHFACLLLACGK